MNVTLFVPAQTAFSEDVRAWARPGAERQRHNFLRMAHTINGGGVDPVNAKFERAMNRGDRLFVVLLAPTKFPTRSTNGPGPKTNGRNRQVGIPELLRFHINLRNSLGFHFSCFHFLSSYRVDIVCEKLCRTGGAERSGAIGSALFLHLRDSAAVVTPRSELGRSLRRRREARPHPRCLGKSLPPLAFFDPRRPRDGFGWISRSC